MNISLEQLRTNEPGERFDSTVGFIPDHMAETAEASADTEQSRMAFDAIISQLDTIDPKTEKSLEAVAVGKRYGCQDTGGGGYEWNKTA